MFLFSFKYFVITGDSYPVFFFVYLFLFLFLFLSDIDIDTVIPLHPSCGVGSRTLQIPQYVNAQVPDIKEHSICI